LPQHADMASQSFRRILELLEQHDVEYVVVGGVAAVLQGAPVTTFDIDALVKLDDTNADRLMHALTALEARYREHQSDVRPTREDILAGGHLLLITNNGPLDVLGFIGNGKRYEDVAGSIENIDVGGLPVRVLDLKTLIAEKRALGRDKDQPMLRLLEAVLRRRT
jgi:predicted nucleotidyltransferase